MKILYVSMSAANKLNSFYDAINDLYTDVDVIYKDSEYQSPYEKRTKFVTRIKHRLGYPEDNGLNERLLAQVKSHSYDVVIIVKGIVIFPETLKEISTNFPKVKLVSWSVDDMYARHNRSRYYTKGLKYYDLVVTLKSYNCNPEELPSLGAKEVYFLYNAFDKRIHVPAVDTENGNIVHNVIFIGYAEWDRYDYINTLAEAGVEVHVYGAGWDDRKYQSHHENLYLHFQNVVDEDYANAISSAKIGLCFLRKINRDLHTCRSVEIPACRTLMIAERTDEHQKLYAEDKEAVYFDNKQEFVDKVKFYLEHESTRLDIEEAGYRKTIDQDYSYHNMVGKIFDKLESLK